MYRYRFIKKIKDNPEMATDNTDERKQQVPQPGMGTSTGHWGSEGSTPPDVNSSAGNTGSWKSMKQ